MSKILPKFKAINKHGKLIFDNQEQVEGFLFNMPGVVYVSISKSKMSRSNSQNAYYWSIVINLISSNTGYTPEETHNILCAKFLKSFVMLETKEGNKEVEIVRSTTSLTTVEFEDYLSQVRQWASLELSCYIPLPNEVSY